MQCQFPHVLRNPFFHLRAHSLFDPVIPVRRAQHVQSLVRPLVVVILHPPAYAFPRLLEGRKTRPVQELFPDRLPEPFDLAQGLRVVRSAADMLDPVACQFLLELGLAIPTRILPPVSAGSFRARLHRLCTKAKVSKRPPYALRHTFATNLAGDNTNMTIIGQLMGHSTLRTTQRYIANNFEYQQTAMDRLADRFSTLAGDKMATKVVPKVVPVEKAFAAVEAPAYVNDCRKAG